MTAAALIFAWGNPSRGDDALGPLFAERAAALFAARPDWGEVECLTDFQLQVEHALDLQGRSRVLFVDASADCAAPFATSRIEAARDTSYSTHAMTPQAVLHVYRQLHREAPPPTWLLAIRGVRFALGEELSDDGRRHLDAALDWAVGWLGGAAAQPCRSSWSTPIAHGATPT